MAGSERNVGLAAAARAPSVTPDPNPAESLRLRGDSWGREGKLRGDSWEREGSWRQPGGVAGGRWGKAIWGRPNLKNRQVIFPTA